MDVGDIVVGTNESDSKYRYTNSRCILVVIESIDEKFSYFKVIRHAVKSIRGRKYKLYNKYFKLADKADIQTIIDLSEKYYNE